MLAPVHELNVTFDVADQGSSGSIEDPRSGERTDRRESPTYQARAGDVIDDRYQLLFSDPLGSGTFATVHAAMDLRTQSRVAMKIIRKQPNFNNIGIAEIAVLQRLATKDEILSRTLFSELLDYFLLDGHQCLIFPLYGPSVFDFISKNGYRGFTLKQAIHMTYQLVAATQYMHHIGLIHTDVKAENVFIVDGSYDLMDNSYQMLRSSFVRLGDFNSTTDFVRDDKNNLVQTKNYRSPEVAAGMPWTEAIDIWSIGCLMYELIVGELLLECEVDSTNDRSEYEQKRFIQLCESVTMLLPAKFLGNANKRIPDMDHFRVKEFEYPKYVSRLNREDMLRKMLLMLPSDKDDLDLHYYRLVGQMLTAQPEERITAAEALKHRLFCNIDDAKRFNMSHPVFEQHLTRVRRFDDRVRIEIYELKQLNKKKPPTL